MLQQTDIRVAEEHATFGLREAKFGLIAGAGSTVRLKRQIPYTKAMEMILTGEPLTAVEAYHFGQWAMSCPPANRWRKRVRSPHALWPTDHWPCATRRKASPPSRRSANRVYRQVIDEHASVGGTVQRPQLSDRRRRALA